jgi:hypothetical protein
MWRLKLDILLVCIVVNDDDGDKLVLVEQEFLGGS